MSTLARVAFSAGVSDAINARLFHDAFDCRPYLRPFKEYYDKGWEQGRAIRLKQKVKATHELTQPY